MNWKALKEATGELFSFYALPTVIGIVLGIIVILLGFIIPLWYGISSVVVLFAMILFGLFSRYKKINRWGKE